MDNYIQLALVTKSPDFHGEIVPADMLIDALSDFITAANRLDKIKKAMFYRKLIEGVGGIFQGSNRIHKEWKLNDNSELTETSAIDIIHSILGKATESGELCEQLITTFQTGVFDPVNFKEEIGDSQWYDAIGLAALGETSFDNNQKSNIAKLQDRFKGKFDAYFANNRDLESERKTLEGL